MITNPAIDGLIGPSPFYDESDTDPSATDPSYGSSFFDSLVHNLTSVGGFSGIPSVSSAFFPSGSSSASGSDSTDYADLIPRILGTVYGEADRDRNFNAHQAELSHQRALEILSRQMAFNSNESAISRKWQEEMSSTQYQRAVKDLSSAGLNPVLAYTNLSNNVPSSAISYSPTSPSGAQASHSTPAADTISTLLSAVSTSVKSFSSVLSALAGFI